MYAGGTPVDVDAAPVGRVVGGEVENGSLQLPSAGAAATPGRGGLLRGRREACELPVLRGAPVAATVVAAVARRAHLALDCVPAVRVKGFVAETSILAAVLAAGARWADRDAEAPLEVATKVRVWLAGVARLAWQEPAACSGASVLSQAKASVLVVRLQQFLPVGRGCSFAPVPLYLWLRFRNASDPVPTPLCIGGQVATS